ncbi:MAG: putative urea transporter ATP-binding protein [Phycisphaerales bacterium]|nr:putative urea transporter ATP-binding protein [Phycisphaerales bacterium]
MLEVTGLNFHYGNVQALYDISMSMPSGQITCVMGRNGVGKTTLLKNIMGVESSTTGRVAVDGADVAALPANKRARSGLALVPQGRMIFPKLSVMENMKVGLSARTDGVKTVPTDVMDLFPILKTFANRNGGDLSGGQQQQLAIARALCGNPKVLLLDEPTEGIQPNVIQMIGEVLQMLAKTRNMTIVLVEQYLDFVREITQNFYVLNRGRVVAAGPTAELSEDVVTQHLKV